MLSCVGTTRVLWHSAPSFSLSSSSSASSWNTWTTNSKVQGRSQTQHNTPLTGLTTLKMMSVPDELQHSYPTQLTPTTPTPPLSSSPGAQNAFARFLLCCLKCCFWCLEHFIKFMNRNAYIMVSVTSHPASFPHNLCTAHTTHFITLIIGYGHQSKPHCIISLERS